MLPLTRAAAQLFDPVIQGVVLRSVALAAAVFVALLVGSVFGVRDMVAQLASWPGWIAWIIGALGGIGAALLALWLFVPAAVLIATMYMERVAVAVERRWYPTLPPPRAAPWAAQAWDGAVLSLQLIPLQLLTLILTLFVPGLGLVLGFCITGWAIGRGLFVAVAMRRMDRPAALQLYEQRRAAVLLPSMALAALGVVPFANLLVPVLAIAAMVHVLNGASQRTT